MSDDLRKFLNLGQSIKRDLDALGVGKPPTPEPDHLSLLVPDSVRYILWRYSQDHSGEDHQKRVVEAAAWLADVSVSVLPPGPMAELTPARVAALAQLLALAEVEAPSYSDVTRTEIETAAVVVSAMLDEAQGR